MTDTILCPWESPFLLIFSSNVPPLLYYSHLPVLIASILLGFAIYRKSRDLASSILVTVLGLFSFYALLDVLIWATNRSDIVLFLWSIQVMIEVLIFAAAFYLIYLVINKRDAPFEAKVAIGAILIPFILLIPSPYNLAGIDLSYCDAIEGFVGKYLSYALEAFFALLIVFYSVHKYFRAEDKKEKKKIFVLTLGTLLFLTALISGNVIGSFTGNWDLAQFGFFGMPIFIWLMTYLIVEYKIFSLRLIGAQIFVLSLWALIISILFIQDLSNIRIVTIITFMLAVVFGVLLIRSVKREIKLREELQKANEGQATLIHFINHQIKGYLSKSRIIFAELLNEPEYEPVSDSAKGLLKTGEESLKEGVDFVQNILKASDIEKGTFAYDMGAMDFRQVVEGVVENLREKAESKGLEYKVDIHDGEYEITGDEKQLHEAVKNLIDNSINYTPEGRVEVSLKSEGEKIRFEVKDTGVGLSEEVKPKLFTKGGRAKDSLKVNVNSTGYGLAIVKGIAEAHNGQVWAESEGKGKGSIFYMELPRA